MNTSGSSTYSSSYYSVKSESKNLAYLEILSLNPSAKIYHPLPRHKLKPTVPKFIDNLTLNGYEKQSQNGCFLRMALLSVIGGKQGNDFKGKSNSEENYDDCFIEELDVVDSNFQKHQYKQGVRPIENGIVIDHISKGKNLNEIKYDCRRIEDVLNIESEGGPWKSKSNDDQYKGLIFLPNISDLNDSTIKKLAAVSPHCTLNFISDKTVTKKLKLNMPPKIYNFPELNCKNGDCISNKSNGEPITNDFHRKHDKFICDYCDTVHDYDQVWD